MVTVLTDIGELVTKSSPIYNMVPPPGAPASFDFNAAGPGIFVHVLGHVRSDDDFGLSGGITDVLALATNPVIIPQTQLWGDVAAASHDVVRGACVIAGGSCSNDEPTGTVLITQPTDCSEAPLVTSARSDSWGSPAVEHHASYSSAGLAGAPMPTEPIPVWRLPRQAVFENRLWRNRELLG